MKSNQSDSTLETSKGKEMQRTAAIVRFRWAMTAFIIGLVASGLTAFPLLQEMRLLCDWLGLGGLTSPAGQTGLPYWLLSVRFGLEETYARFPWIAYGTDWLAFAHIAIALFFVGALVRPAESRATLCVGIAACILVFPTALICGALRGIPPYWRLIDCSFGIVGSIPLIYCLRLLKEISGNQSNHAAEAVPVSAADRVDMRTAPSSGQAHL